jgi:hypothetical protein
VHQVSVALSPSVGTLRLELADLVEIRVGSVNVAFLPPGITPVFVGGGILRIQLDSFPAEIDALDNPIIFTLILSSRQQT